jgi:replicative DNA helicase
VVDFDESLALAASILRDGVDALKVARERGIKPAMLKGAGRTAYDFIDDYYKQYGDLPSAQIVEAKFGISIPNVKEAADFFARQVLERELQKDLKQGAAQFDQVLQANQPYETLDALEKIVRGIRKAHAITESKAESVPKLWPEVLDHYDRVKAGEKGILTPWPTVNDETLGFWPEDLALFAARMGIGKTWCAAIIAHHAWLEQKKKILFGTTEISKLRIAMRFAAIHFKLPYREIRLGKLDAFNEQRFRDGVKEIMEAEGLYVIGGDFDFRVESYENAVEEVAPDLSVLDGAYLLKTEGKTRTERAANAFDELKRICKRTSCPNIVTMQFNREVKANVASSVQAEKIALTDVAGWNADLCYGLIQTEDMKKDRRMIFKPLKVREGEGEEFEVNWDIDKVDFSELAKAGDGVVDADPFGAGIGSDDQADVPF